METTHDLTSFFSESDVANSKSRNMTNPEPSQSPRSTRYGTLPTMVGNSLAHISKLSGKELYDAVVSIDKISAVRMKMRDK